MRAATKSSSDGEEIYIFLDVWLNTSQNYMLMLLYCDYCSQAHAWQHRCPWSWLGEVLGAFLSSVLPLFSLMNIFTHTHISSLSLSSPPHSLSLSLQSTGNSKARIETATPEACCLTCRNTEGCDYWTWTKTDAYADIQLTEGLGNGCYLKHQSASTVYVMIFFYDWILYYVMVLFNGIINLHLRFFVFLFVMSYNWILH